MLKFKVTPERFTEVASILEYIAITQVNRDVALKLLPRFLLNDEGEYMVTVTLDDDGDITNMENINEAFMKMSAITPKRLEKLAQELAEAAKAIVNPPNAGGSNGRTATDTPKPPGG